MPSFSTIFSKKFIWYNERSGFLLFGYSRESHEALIPMDVLFICFQFYYSGTRRFALSIEKLYAYYKLSIFEYKPFAIGKIKLDTIRMTSNMIDFDTVLREKISKVTNINKKRLIISRYVPQYACPHYQVIKKVTTDNIEDAHYKSPSKHCINICEISSLKQMITQLEPISSKPVKKSKIMFVEHIIKRSNIGYRIGDPLLIRLPINCKIKPGKLVRIIERSLYPFLVMEEIEKYQQIYGKNALPYYITMITPFQKGYNYDRGKLNVNCGIPHKCIKGFKCKTQKGGCALTENDNWKIKIATLADGKCSFVFAIRWQSNTIAKKCYNFGECLAKLIFLYYP
eukprot:163666_1